MGVFKFYINLFPKYSVISFFSVFSLEIFSSE